MTCVNCGLAYDAARWPLGRPRRDGSRHPGRYCDTCLSLANGRDGYRAPLQGGGHAALLEAKAAYRARQRGIVTGS